MGRSRPGGACGGACGDAPVVGLLPLSDPRAADPLIAGAKGANLARCHAARFPVLPGYVVPTDVPSTTDMAAALADVHDRWRPSPLVVRSSSTVEDIGTSSMAGQFRSVLGVRSGEELVAAVETVLRSAHLTSGEAAPMAVLLQPQLDPAVSGVLFGVDPVTGHHGRLVVEAVTGTPEQLVSGQVSAERLTLDRRGRLLEVDGVRHRHGWPRHALLDRSQCRALSRLAGALKEHFGTPQDVEWAFDQDGSLVLLQTRPVTTHAVRPTGPVLGPGPVAETFPYPLRPLESDLWLQPMRRGIAAALDRVGVVPHAELTASPVVVDVAGWPAADLSLFGYLDRRPRGWQWLDPRPPARRLAAAWRLGSIRARLHEQGAALLETTDGLLSTVVAPTTLTDDQTISLLEILDQLLVDLHRHEVLAAALSAPSETSLAGEALAALALGRGAGLSEAEIVHQEPVVLALVPPRVGKPWPLPDPGSGSATPRGTPGLRELIRLRIRWVHELQARSCRELGHRWASAGRLPDAEAVAWLRRDELSSIARGSPVPPELVDRVNTPAGPPLPSRFQLSADGVAVPAERPGSRPTGGVGAGGGRGIGAVVHASSVEPNAQADSSSTGKVLVVRALDPSLAARLPGLAGLVAESGSTLSHLAILAREHHVPTVVAVHDALHRFPPGCRLLVDGSSGEIRQVDEQEVAP